MFDTLPGWVGRLDGEERARFNAARKLDARERQLRMEANDPNNPFRHHSQEELEEFLKHYR